MDLKSVKCKVYPSNLFVYLYTSTSSKIVLRSIWLRYFFPLGGQNQVSTMRLCGQTRHGDQTCQRSAFSVARGYPEIICLESWWILAVRSSASWMVVSESYGTSKFVTKCALSREVAPHILETYIITFEKKDVLKIYDGRHGRGQRIVIRWSSRSWSPAGCFMPKRKWLSFGSRNKVEAATKQTIHAEGIRGFPPSQHPLFSQENWCLQELQPGSQGGPLGELFAKLRVFGNHHYPWVSHSHWCLCLFSLWVFGRHYCTIPDSVTAIGNSAFQDCISLESITIPESETDIGMRAFCGCREASLYLVL